MKRRARAIADTLGPARKLGLILFAFVFALQAYIVQTHIHHQLTAPAVMVMSIGDGHPPADPIDPHTCKLCREIVIDGAGLIPAVPQLLLLLDWVATAIPAAQLHGPAIPPESGWQSRAPPTH